MWGSAFLLLLCLSLLGLAAELPRIRRALASSPLSFQFRATPPGRGFWFSGDRAAFERQSPLSRPILPWMEICFARPYGRSAGEGAYRPRVEASRAARSASGSLPGRGTWRADGFWVLAKDMLGLARGGYWVDAPDEFTVIGDPSSFDSRVPSGGGGRERRSSNHFRRTDEQLDSRKYLPGDDARRINWKQFGHSGELFTRIGEREPPPKSRFIVLIDPERARGLPEALAEAYLDRLVALASGCVLALSSAGARVGAAAPGIECLAAPEDEDADPLSPMRQLAYLNQVLPDSGDSDFMLPASSQAAEHRASLILFCPPGGKRSERFLSASGNRAGNVAAFIPLMEVPTPGAALMAMLMRGSGPAVRAAFPNFAKRSFNREASAFADSLRRSANVEATAL
jgi:uncharacterized protein (DUF58 family)